MIVETNRQCARQIVLRRYDADYLFRDFMRVASIVIIIIIVAGETMSVWPQKYFLSAPPVPCPFANVCPFQHSPGLEKWTGHIMDRLWRTREEPWRWRCTSRKEGTICSPDHTRQASSFIRPEGHFPFCEQHRSTGH